MPPYPEPKSKAQNRLMQGVASGDITGSGVPKKVAKEFTKGAHGKSLRGLPQRKGKR
jgi:hypothetical protein